MSQSGWPSIIRPIQPGDEGVLAPFLQSLTDEDLAKRFGRRIDRRSSLVRRFLFGANGPLGICLGAFNPSGSLVGTASLGAIPPDYAEIAVIEAARARSRGLGIRLVSELKVLARNLHLGRLEALVALDNRAGITLAKRTGFCANSLSDLRICFEQTI